MIISKRQIIYRAYFIFIKIEAYLPDGTYDKWLKSKSV